MHGCARGSILALAALAVLSGGGCRSGEKYRSGVQFHVEAVTTALAALEKEVPRHNENGMRGALRRMNLLLGSLPDRIRKAGTQVDKQAALAEKVIDVFNEASPKLLSLEYQDADMLARIQQMRQMLEEIAAD